MRIIPAIDIIDGKCVRLSQGDYDRKKVYNENPLEVAKMFEDAGIRYLHLVDLDGAKAKHIVNWKVLETIASQTKLKIDFGGGIKTDDDLRIAFESGSRQITGGSIAVQNASLFVQWIDRYGNEKIILGADAKNEKVSITGWTDDTETDVGDFIAEYHEKGIQYVICTDIAKDGMLQGVATDLYEKIMAKTPEIKLIASGGVSTIDDIHALAEQRTIEGVIVGKAIYEGKISLSDLSKLC